MRYLSGPTPLWLFAVPVAATMLAGCGSAPKPAQDAGPAATADESAPQADAAARAQAYAERLATAMAPHDGAGAPPDIRWLEPGSAVPSPQPAAQPTPQPQPAAAVPAPEPAPEPAAPDATAQAPAAEAPDVPPPPAYADLLQQLLARIEAGDRPALARAVDAATLSLLDPSRALDRQLLEPLGFEDRAIVERYHQVLSLLVAELARGEAKLDRKALDARLDDLFGQQPIAIRAVELCSRVTGYGIYEPFEEATFLSGRDQKMIVYVELDNFQAAEPEPGRYEVKLEQEIALFNESDGLAVWRSDPVNIVDTSRNRRRDFFVVQLITLPARLSVGKYRLKVRITDQHGGSLDERTVPLEIVADESMVQR